MNLTVQSENWAKRHKRKFDAVITLEDPDHRNGLRFHQQPSPAHLIQTYVDLDRPAPEPYCLWPIFKLATEDQVWEAIDFAQGRDSVLVHCRAGIGRSTAIALAILASQMGKGAEKEALSALLTIRPEAVPNLHIVGLADAVLGREGRLLETVRYWDSALPKNQRRRALNRQSHFTFYGLFLPDDA
jgi:predicted protein tyrosine phosphatase